jgi:hypothetical protein
MAVSKLKIMYLCMFNVGNSGYLPEILKKRINAPS